MNQTPTVDIDALVPKFRKGMKIEDRKYRGKTYPQCFIGTEAVTWLVLNVPCKSRAEAVEVGQKIMDKKVFHHVVYEHRFKDKDFFYSFFFDPNAADVPSQSELEAMKTLYERLGGQKAISAVVEDFVERVRFNKVVIANPIVKKHFDEASMPALKYSVTELVCQATGGPQTYTGKNMRDAHKGMKITEEEWNAFCTDFKATLDKFKVPDKEQGELITIVLSLKGETLGSSLYDRLGGVAGIATVVDDFIDRIMKNDVLNANPKVKEAHNKVSKAHFKYLVTELVSMACGGPQKYTGRNMKDSHKHLEITEKEWAAFAAEFQNSLNHFKVPEKEQKELFAIVGSLKPDVIASPKTLYERLGGFHSIATVVDDFLDRVSIDNMLNENPNLKTAMQNSNVPAFKNLTTELVCMACGGPQKYSGKDMKEAHKNMKITEKEWSQFVKLFKATLDKFSVPVKEQTELVNIVASLKADIVTV